MQQTGYRQAGATTKARTAAKPKAIFGQGDVIASRYQVKRLLGRGGMGEVYLVFDGKRHHHMALKTLLPKFTGNSRAVGRFVREVIAVRRFNHPGIVKMYDACRCGSLLYYTMEYLPGLTLRRYLKRLGRIEIGPTYQILTLICNALEHVHLATVHRDVSPENIMLLPNRTVKIVDFGLSRCDKRIFVDRGGRVIVRDIELGEQDEGQVERFTLVGSKMGKIEYSAPEQRTDASKVDARSDIYALGVMFFEMLTGKIPPKYSPITKILPDLPTECDAFLAKAMARDPEDRFDTVADFRAELERIYLLSCQPAANPRRAPEGRRPIVFARLLGWLFGRRAATSGQA